MSQFDTTITSTDVYSRPLAPWEDQSSHAPSTLSSWRNLKDPNIQVKPGGVGSGNLHRTGSNYKPISEVPATIGLLHEGSKKNVLQTPAFKNAIAATIGQKQQRVPSRNRQREEIAKGTNWGKKALSKAPLWTMNTEQPPEAVVVSDWDTPQIQEQCFQPQAKMEENVLATFDISFVSDAENGIFITPSNISNTLQSVDMALEKSNNSSIHSAPQQPTATTSMSSVTSSGLGGSETSMWATAREEEQKKLTSKWNVKAQSFQFNDDKPTTPIFEFAKPNEEPETPFFTFSQKQEPPLFDFSTALNHVEKVEEDNLFGTNESMFSCPVAKKVTITSPPKKPNPKAPAFTPTIAKAERPATSPLSKHSSTWNPKVTEFIPVTKKEEEPLQEEEEDYIPNFVTRPKSAKIVIKPPPAVQQEEEKEEVVKKPEVKEEVKKEVEMVFDDLESQTQPETTRGFQEPIPILQMNISFAPGVTSTLLLFEQDQPKHVVAEFCRKHDLTMTHKSQKAFAETLEKLKQAKLKSLSKMN